VTVKLRSQRTLQYNFAMYKQKCSISVVYSVVISWPRSMGLLKRRLQQHYCSTSSPITLAKGPWIGNFKPNGSNIKIAISCEVWSTCNFKNTALPVMMQSCRQHISIYFASRAFES